MGFKIKDLLGGAASDLVEKVGAALDKNITTKDEKLEAKTNITKLVAEFSDKALNIQKDVIMAEMQGNSYQRSWRPSLMYMAMFIIFSTWFIFPIINVWAQDPNITDFIGDLKNSTDFWDIIKLGVGAFGIGRTVEKVAKDVVNNVDVNLKNKK